MTRERGELTDVEEALLGIERPSIEEENEAKRVLDEKLELRRVFLAGLMANQVFREFMMQHLTWCGTFDNPLGFGPNGFPDPMGTQFLLGNKAAGWRLWEILDEISPDQASLMRREARIPRP